MGGAPGILYISYDGMLEPLGQSQVVAYLEKLAPGRRIHLISFEKPRDWVDEARRKARGAQGDMTRHWSGAPPAKIRPPLSGAGP